jgi:hypothetical protein
MNLWAEIGAWFQALGAYLYSFEDSLGMFSSWWDSFVRWVTTLWNNIITLWGLLD